MKVRTCSDHWTSFFIRDSCESYFALLIRFEQSHQVRVLLQFHRLQYALHHVPRHQECDRLAVSSNTFTPIASASLTALGTDAASSVMVKSAFCTEKMLIHTP